MAELNYRAIFETGSVSYLVLWPDAPVFTIAGASDAYLKATGRTRAELVGRPIFEAFPENPDDLRANSEGSVRGALERVVRTRKIDTLPVTKYDVPKEGGGYTVKYWSPVHFPVFDEAGALIHIVQRVEDVTEFMELRGREEAKAPQKRTAERIETELMQQAQGIKADNVKLAEANALLDQKGRELAALNERLQELDAAKTDFFANVSHEFRTPLTLLLGPLEDLLAGSRGDLPAPARTELEVIQRNALRLLRQVNALLDFSRLDAKRHHASRVATDLAHYTRELVSMFQPSIERAALKLRVDIEPLAKPVFVDREMWEKIVGNLISNAFKFTLQGEIGVSLRGHGDRVELSVRDTGCGIPKAELPHMFERFHRIKESRGRSFEGSGIGLAIVSEFAELHGGSVAVESAEGVGTTFTVALPAGVPAGAAATADAEGFATAKPRATSLTAVLSEVAGWSGRGSVALESVPSVRERPPSAELLVVDDNPDMRGYLSRLLSTRWLVATASNGREALALIRENVPDLVLSDVMMPELDGPGLLRALREDPRTREVPVVLLSARTGEEALVAGLSLGADDYVMKPFSAPELLARVQTHLEIARVRRQWAAQLQQANHELEAFSYSVSHDLRAPLRAIDGFSRALLDDEGENLKPDSRKYLERVRAATKRMGDLIEDLLNLSRVGRASLSRERIELSSLAREVVDTLRERDQQRKVSVELTPDLIANADPRLVKVLLENLIGNAWKFTSKKPEARIVLGHETRDGENVFYVRDDGAGFEMTYASKLFSPFQRLHRAADFDGTGIGLATAQRIVARHGGRIWTEAAIDRGATFFFTLEAV